MVNLDVEIVLLSPHQVGTLQLLDISSAAENRHAVDYIGNVLIRGAHWGVTAVIQDKLISSLNGASTGDSQEAWRDAVHSSKLAPVLSERSAKVNYGSFGSVVRCLRVRHVDDTSRDTSRSDERARSLLTEDGSDGLGGIERRVQVDRHGLVPALKVVVLVDRTGHSAAGIGNEAVQATKIGLDGLYSLLD